MTLVLNLGLYHSDSEHAEILIRMLVFILDLHYNVNKSFNITSAKLEPFEF
jgi:hypothetical protein